VLEQADKRTCVCPIPGSVQDQVGWGSGQLGLVPDLGGRPVMPGGVQPKLFYDSMISFLFLTETPKLTFTSCLDENSCGPCYQHLALPTKLRPCGMVTLMSQTLISDLSSLRKLLSFAAL